MKTGFYVALACFALTTAAALAQFSDPFVLDARLTHAANGAPQVTLALGMPEDHYLYADKLTFSLNEARLEVTGGTPPTMQDDPFMDGEVGIYRNGATVLFALPAEVTPPVTLHAAYQGCNATLCLPPFTKVLVIDAAGAEADASVSPSTPPRATSPLVAIPDGFTIIGTDSGYKSPKAFLKFLDRVESGKTAQADGLAGLLQRRGLLVLVVVILVGGLALNLTPCILPMIPINLAIIGAGAQAGSKARGFFLGGVYGAGIALAYGALGLIVVLTGASFGTLNASPWFNLGIALLFVVMALAMFGIINLDLSKFQRRPGTGQKDRKGALVPTFAMGVVAALLAGACVAPVVISVLLLSAELYQAGQTMALALPFLLGIGMALPWPFAGAGLSFLPKPGAWMERTKLVFGVLILVMGLWYGKEAIGLWRGHSAGDHVVGTDEERSRWLHDLPAAVEASRESGRPIFIDFWAGWCKNCLAMDKITFKNEQVLEHLDTYIPLKIRAEDPSDPDTAAVMQTFGVLGLPTYVVIAPARSEE